MIGLDTNILARYYIEDETDSESLIQREAARRLIESGKPLTVCKTVLFRIGMGNAWILPFECRTNCRCIAAFNFSSARQN